MSALLPKAASKKRTKATNSQTTASKKDDDDSPLVAAIREVSHKVEASLSTLINEHVSSKDFSPHQGVDFLDTKNTMLVSYLIDLTVNLRNQLLLMERGKNSQDPGAIESVRHRLTEVKVAMDKLRGLDKKLRYQLDKILAAADVSKGTNAAAFAVAGPGPEVQQPEDPLQFRPNMADDDDDSSSSDEDGPPRKGGDSDADDDSEADGSDGVSDDMDEDLANARMTLTMAKEKKREKVEEDRLQEQGVYRAPRLTAVPYTNDQVEKEVEREKRDRRRMRASEVAQTLRSQYGEQPELEDVFGGSNLGRQRQAARRLTEREAEKTKYEEDTMIRLTTSRKEKKEYKKMLREETSNLSALASDLDRMIHGDDKRRDRLQSGRDNKRDRYEDAFDTGQNQTSRRKSNSKMKSKNDLQAALYGENDFSGKKKKKSKR